MKYIIQESKLKSIAKNYLERELGNFEWATPLRREIGYVGEYYKDGNRIAVVMRDGISMTTILHKTIKNLFNLTDKEISEIINEIVNKRIGSKDKKFVGHEL